MGQKMSLGSVFANRSGSITGDVNMNESHENCEAAPKSISQVQLDERFSKMPYRLAILLDMPSPPPSMVNSVIWNKKDCSANIRVLHDGSVCVREPVAQSTDCIRATVGFESGLHVWDITWEAKQRGTHAMIGVATKSAPLRSRGYISLIGSNKESWGWDLGRSKILHDCMRNPPKPYPKLKDDSEMFVLPETIRVILDMNAGTLAFMADGKYLGVAFKGLKGLTLFPIISAVWGHCEIKIRYINGLKPGACSLKELSRHAVRVACTKWEPSSLPSKKSEIFRTQQIKSLPLPNTLIDYLLQ